MGLVLSGCEMLPTGGPTQPVDIEEAGEGTPAGTVERQVAFPAEEYAGYASDCEFGLWGCAGGEGHIRFGAKHG